MIGLVLAATLAQAAPAAQPAFASLVERYLVCVRRRAAQLEVGGDPPDAVAKAAAQLCGQEAVDVANFQIKNPSQSSIIGGGVQGSGEAIGLMQAVVARYCPKTAARIPGEYGLPKPR